MICNDQQVCWSESSWHQSSVATQILIIQWCKLMKCKESASNSDEF